MPIQSKKDLKYYLEQDRIALKHPAGFVLKKDSIWKFEILLRKAEYYCNCMPGILKIIGSLYKRRLLIVLDRDFRLLIMAQLL